MKDNLPMVSIIIPTYNCAEYIEEAVLSAINQTYPNKEIIVVDDGSTDNTEDILKKYKDQVKIIYQLNQGVSRARNNGIFSAKGKYIATLDADDRWLNTRLEKLIPILEENRFDILISNFYQVDENRKRIGNKAAFPSDYREPQKQEQYESLLTEATAFALMITHRERVVNIGGYDETLKGEAEDYDLWLRLLKNGARWGFNSEPLVEMMFRFGSLSKGYSPERAKALKNIFNKHIDRIGNFRAYRLYRYHLGGYRWDMILVSVKEKSYKKIIKHVLIMLRSPLFIPVICSRICKKIYRKL